MTRLFPASVVGSMPRTDFVRDLISQETNGDPERRSNNMDAAVRYIVALQERAGLDVVTDGEWRRKSYIGVIAELAHGFQIGTYGDGRPYTVVSSFSPVALRTLSSLQGVLRRPRVSRRPCI